VFRNALVRFGERFFIQQWGFAMGTAVAPDAANVFMAVCEDLCGVYTASALSSVLPAGAELLLFARLIDDYTIIVSGDANVLHSPTSPLEVQAVKAVTAELEARAGPHLRISLDCFKTIDGYTRPTRLQRS
jgi:hypothetical protein